MSNGRPFIPFTVTFSPFSGAIQQRVFIHGAGFESNLLSGRFSYASGVRAPLALVVGVVVATQRARCSGGTQGRTRQAARSRDLCGGGAPSSRRVFAAGTPQVRQARGTSQQEINNKPAVCVVYIYTIARSDLSASDTTGAVRLSRESSGLPKGS